MTEIKLHNKFQTMVESESVPERNNKGKRIAEAERNVIRERMRVKLINQKQTKKNTKSQTNAI